MALTHALRNRGLKALYARAETFTEDVVSAIRNSEMQTFRQAYRNIDVLLIDGIHIFSRKDATQEEFFHTFNALHSSGKQIIISSPYPASQLEHIEPRLTSRFEWGIALHLEPLSLEEQLLVLKKKCESLHFPLNEELLSYLASTFRSTHSLHRALEALILRIHMQENKYPPEQLTQEIVSPLLSDLVRQEEGSAPSAEKIIANVATYFEISVEDLLGKSQRSDCTTPRQIAIYLCRKELRLPFMKIGEIFSRDHSTVMTSVKNIEKKLEAQEKSLLSCLLAVSPHLRLGAPLLTK